MNCPACGSPVNAGDAYCSSCGQPVAAVAPQPTTPIPPAQTAQQPTVPIPPAQTAPTVASPPPPSQAGTWQPTQQMPRVEPQAGHPTPGAPVPPGSYAPQAGYPSPPAYQTSAAPPKRGISAGAIVGIVVGVIVVLSVAAAIIVLAVLPRLRGEAAPPAPPTQTEVPAPSPTEPPVAETEEGVFADALEAAKAEVPGDYVIELAEETDDRKVYWAGPPNSEWDAVIVVDRVEQGWKVTESTPFNAAEPDGDSGEPAAADTSAAEDLVKKFLTAIKNDKPGDAQRLTISPLREDPASAQYANGEFKKFTIDRTEAEDDDTFWVYTTQTWSYGTEKWRYDVVPTEAGLRIRNLEYVE